MAWSLFHVHARRVPPAAMRRAVFTPHVEAAGHGAARPHPWGRRISHMGSRIRTAPARDAPNHPPAPLSGWVRSWPSCPTGASAPPYGAPTTNGRLHWGCHVPHRQEASDELASRRRERGTVSAEPLTLRTMAPLRTCQPRSSLSALRRFHQGFTDVQLVSDFSWHRFQVGLPCCLFAFTACLRPRIARDALTARRWALGARPVCYHFHLIQTLDLCDLVSH